MAFIMMVLIIMRYLETFLPSLESIASYTWSEYYDPIEILCSLDYLAGISFSLFSLNLFPYSLTILSMCLIYFAHSPTPYPFLRLPHCY